MLGEGFRVVAEFVFSVDNAVSASELLAEKVEKLSQATEEAGRSIAFLGLQYVKAFSGAETGVLGILGNAIKASDKFRSTQIELANTMTANKMTIDGSVMSFNEALTQADFIMGNIVSKARQFGISPTEFTSQVKFYNAMLAPKGLAGNNLSNAIELSRVSMKAAPALGVGQDQMISGIMSGISGQLSKQTQFGSRLFMESGDLIKLKTGIKDLNEFNKAIPSKRIEAMIVGLDKLAGSADAITARADTLHARLLTIEELFIGVGSILKPLGDVILPLIKETLDVVINYLKTDGKKIVEQVAIFIKGFIKGPKQMILDFIEISRLGSMLSKTVKIGSFIVFLTHMKYMTEILKEFSMTRGIGTFIESFGSAISKIPIIGKIGTNAMNLFTESFRLTFGQGFFKFIGSFARASAMFSVLLGTLFIPIAGFNRALSRVKFEYTSEVISGIPTFMESLNKLWVAIKGFFTPLNDAIEGWSKLFEPFLKSSRGLTAFLSTFGNVWDVLFGTMEEKFRASQELLYVWGSTFSWVIDLISNFVDALLSLYGAFTGLIAGISALTGGLFGGASPKDQWSFANEAFTKEFERVMDRNRTPTLGPNGEQKTVANNINNNYITMNNSFKEVLQPDRIAFTIKDQLEKSSNNRTKARPNGIGAMTAKAVT